MSVMVSCDQVRVIDVLICQPTYPARLGVTRFIIFLGAYAD